MLICRQFARAGDRDRTGDLLFTRQVLYQLSYSGESLAAYPDNCNGGVAGGVFGAWITRLCTAGRMQRLRKHRTATALT